VAVLIGVIVVFGAIFGGFILEGGHLGPLFQPYELLMIVGGAIGASSSPTMPNRGRRP